MSSDGKNKKIVACLKCYHKVRIPTDRVIKHSCPKCRVIIYSHYGIIANNESSNDKLRGVKLIFREVFSPIVVYFSGWTMLVKSDVFAQNIINEKFSVRELIKLTFGSIVLSIFLSTILGGILAEKINPFLLINIPIINELVLCLIFYISSLFSAWIIKISLKSKHYYEKLFEYTFITTASIVMLTLPLSILLEYFLKICTPKDLHITIQNGIAYGMIAGQISMMANILDKIYGVTKNNILYRLIFSYIIFTILVLIITIILFEI